MDNKEIFLAPDVLGNLCLRVAKTLPFLDKMDSERMWEKPIELCKKVESNVREVDNAILEARKNQGYYDYNSSNPYVYQVTITLVYILLYYRHHDDELYKALVFPELKDNMGIYGEKEFEIQTKVCRVFEMERLIEMSKQNKDITPNIFVHPNHLIFEKQEAIVPPQIEEHKDERNIEHDVVSEEIDWHDKVRLDVLLRLMVKDGADLEKHGNKMKAAKIMQSITGLPLQTCKNYCTNRDLNITIHSEEILKMNTLLQSLGMEIRL